MDKVYNHVAYNNTIGEVLMTTRGCDLKRRVEREKRWNMKHGFPSGEWYFSHNGKIPKVKRV